MTGKEIETDPSPKWLRPIDPLAAASLPIRIDSRLEVDDDTAYRLQRDAEPLLTIVTVFVTSCYDNVLAAEVTDDAEHGLHALVRAATGTGTARRAPAATSPSSKLKTPRILASLRSSSGRARSC